MKYCVDCVHLKQRHPISRGAALCHHQASICKTDPVFGVVTYRTALAMRGDINLCGRLGARYFEQKITLFGRLKTLFGKR
jgi:hypothetical protein